MSGVAARAPALVLLLGLTLAPPRASAQPGGAPILAWQESIVGEKESEVRWPVALAAASADQIAVADAQGPRLLVFERSGATWTAVRIVSLPAPPVALVHDGGRYMLALRQPGGLFAVVPPEYRLARVALAQGMVPGALAAALDGALFVHDPLAGRVVALEASGRVRTEVALEGEIGALAAAPGGGFYAALPALGEVRRYGPSGAQRASWKLPGEGPVPAWPNGLLSEPGGELLVLDRHGGRVLLLGPAGTVIGWGARRGWDPGLLRFPSGIAELPGGRVAVADEGNSRIQIFRRLEGG